MPFFESTNSSIFYVDEGAGPPVIFIHGWTCDIHDWVFQIPYFQKSGYRTIAFDTRGHGRSPVPSKDNPSELGPEATVADAEALLRHLDINADNPVVVFGHSSGCLIASLLAISSPRLVRALVLVSPMYYRLQEEGLAQGRKLDGDAYGLVNRIFEAQGTTSETPGWLTARHRIRLLGVPEWVVREAAYQREPVGSWESARKLMPRRQCPRLVVMPNDANVEKEKGLGMGEKDRVEVLRAGHWMHVQESGQFNTLVQLWLAQIS
ncbi:Uu.00g086240.m01.CDS01 [Anthostomella pinea]|uniref:Uu.00g086240.m01.CDS01 n=1 Tax=Anthostomella pinea TaxID=933095 RepID=A0AAI8VM62_9PEZI|nr:Uu.00g086240.m01.CDS01 [Anthostomella pinea]